MNDIPKFSHPPSFKCFLVVAHTISLSKTYKNYCDVHIKNCLTTHCLASDDMVSSLYPISFSRMSKEKNIYIKTSRYAAKNFQAITLFI